MGNTIDMNEMEPVARPLLPIVFVLDTSGSMTGQPISILNHTMEETKSILKNFANSNADAAMKIGVLEFSSGVKWMQPKGLEELKDFVYNPLTAGGLTDLGAALNELDTKLSRRAFLVSTTGRCMPIIIFMTDGQPTDNWQVALTNINNNKWYKNAIKIGFTVGDQANATVISEIVGNSEAVIQTDDFVTFSKMLQKIAVNSAMIGSQSRAPGQTPTGADIVKATMEELGTKNEAKTANDAGITVTSSADTSTDNDPGPWGPDDWD